MLWFSFPSSVLSLKSKEVIFYNCFLGLRIQLQILQKPFNIKVYQLQLVLLHHHCWRFVLLIILLIDLFFEQETIIISLVSSLVGYLNKLAGGAKVGHDKNKSIMGSI